MYNTSIEKGNIRAACNLGDWYYSGEGIEQSYEEAVKWFRYAAMKGYARGQKRLGEEKIGKPDLRIYQILLERYGLKAEECVFIDDRQGNIDAGKQVGIRGILFKNCEQAREEFEQIK